MNWNTRQVVELSTESEKERETETEGERVTKITETCKGLTMFII